MPLHIECEETSVPPVGAVIHGERKLGAITSIAWQDDLGYATALGFVHRSWTPPVRIETAEGSWSATIHPRQ
jgi:hypothetical protein